MLEVEPLQICKNLKYEEVFIGFVDTKEQVLRRRIPYVKVEWSSHSEREAFWELEEEV